jgi:hypothetical protein
MECYTFIFIHMTSNKNRMKIDNILSKCFKRMLTDDKVLEQEMPYMNLGTLKFKERDMVVEILKHWSKSTDNITADQIKQLWYADVFNPMFIKLRDDVN